MEAYNRSGDVDFQDAYGRYTPIQRMHFIVRDVLLLHCLEGKRLESLAELFDLSLETTRLYIRRGLAELRDWDYHPTTAAETGP